MDKITYIPAEIPLNKPEGLWTTQHFNKFLLISAIHKYIIKCTSCGEKYILHPETIIYSFNYGNQQLSFNDDNIDLKLYDQTLPRTKDYICPNSSCETNVKKFNNSNKEAVFYRASKSYYIKYACLNCKTSWNI